MYSNPVVEGKVRELSAALYDSHNMDLHHEEPT